MGATHSGTGNFANTLRALRKGKSLSQQQLANKLFVNRSSVAHWEIGRRVPDALHISRLAGVLGVDISVLLNTAGEETAPPNVIIVDDEKILLAGAISTLAEAMPGAYITGFSRVSEAVNFARNNRVSIAFLDIEMGSVTGLELCKKLVDIHPLTNVIYLTGYPNYSLEAWDTPAIGFLVKPLKLEAVREQLGRLRHPVRGLDRQ